MPEMPEAPREVETPGSITEESSPSGQVTDRLRESRPLAPPPIAQAIAAYLQDILKMGGESKTVQWHQTSLSALQQYLWEQFHLTEVRQLSTEVLQRWVSDLHTVRSPQTGAVPKGQRGLPQPVEATVFVSLLRACQLPDGNVHQDAGLTARNRAILWLMLDTGLSVFELCNVRVGDVDRGKGTLTVRSKGGRTRTLPLSEKGQHAVSAYLEQARLTPAWEPVVPEARDRLFLTEVRHPLTKNSLTLLFVRLNQRAGLTTKPVHPSMLRDTYAVRFLQAGGDLSVLQE
jgi:integrase/recombinase XerD